jgi:hypothetical protein
VNRSLPAPGAFAPRAVPSSRFANGYVWEQLAELLAMVCMKQINAEKPTT